MGYLTSDNKIVDAIGAINISGNVVPQIWYKTIKKDSGKPYLLAISILADIVYWYRPAEVRNQGTGQIVGWKKKFQEDILRRSYQSYADLFGETKRTIKTAMDKLEELQVIRREFRTVVYGDGIVCNNVMYIELKPDVLCQLTFPDELPDPEPDKTEADEKSDVADSETVVTSNMNERDTFTRPDDPMENFGRRGISKFPQTSTKISTDHVKNGGTNTKNTNIEYYNNYKYNKSINLSITPQCKTQKRTERIEDTKQYMELIKKNIDYDSYMSYADSKDKELFEELYGVICDVVCVQRKTINVGKEKYPYELVKAKYLKLEFKHLEYVMDSMKKTTTKINNIRAYMITALYNAPNTLNHFYQQEVQHDLYGKMEQA